MQLSLPAKENEIDSLEKMIFQAMHLKEQTKDREVDWKEIQQSLKEDEALIEIIRFRKYDVLANNDELASQRISIGFTDSVYYAALITSSERDLPILVLLKNGNSLETRYANYYKNTLKFDVNDTISYIQFWKPIEWLVVGKKNLRFGRWYLPTN